MRRANATAGGVLCKLRRVGDSAAAAAPIAGRSAAAAAVAAFQPALTRGFAAPPAKPPAAAAPAPSAPAKKKKGKEKIRKFNHAIVKYGHGAEDRPPRELVREQAREARAQASAKTQVDADGNILTDDESMQWVYDLINKGQIPQKDLLELSEKYPESLRADTLDQLSAVVHSGEYEKLLKVPSNIKGKIRVVDDDLDHLAVTDAELSASDEVTDDPEDNVSAYAKRGGTRPLNEEERLPGFSVARARRAGAAGLGRLPAAADFEGGLSSSSAAGASTGARSSRPQPTRGEGGPLRDVQRGVPSVFAPPAERAVGRAAEEGGSDGSEVDLIPAELRLMGVEWNAEGEGARTDDVFSDDLLAALPPRKSSFLRKGPDDLLSPPLNKMLRGFGTQEAEDDALLTEQTRGLFDSSRGGRNGKSSASGALSMDDSSDWGADPLDFRFEQDPDTLALDWGRRYGMKDADDPRVRELLAVGEDLEHGGRLQGAFGEGLESIPSEVLQEFATPFAFDEEEEGAEFPAPRTVREAAMTAEERALDEQRKTLRELIERPLPLLNRPLWPTYAMIAHADQVTQVVKGGMVQSTRTMIIVGNGMGGAGFGMGKHVEPFMATKMALARAQRDMIHVSTHKGQLYHDLIGKKNSVYVIIRTIPATADVCRAAPLIMDVFEMMGITHASAKIIGQRRRNPYTTVQALFDAFNHHLPPEDEAFKRGLRMQWMGANRLNPNNVYPFSPSGPRYPAANARHITGRMRT